MATVRRPGASWCAALHGSPHRRPADADLNDDLLLMIRPDAAHMIMTTQTAVRAHDRCQCLRVTVPVSRLRSAVRSRVSVCGCRAHRGHNKGDRVSILLCAGVVCGVLDTRVAWLRVSPLVWIASA